MMLIIFIKPYMRPGSSLLNLELLESSTARDGICSEVSTIHIWICEPLWYKSAAIATRVIFPPDRQWYGFCW